MQIVELHAWDVQLDVNGNPVYRKFSVSGVILQIPLVLNGLPSGEPQYQYLVVDGDYTDYCGFSEF